MELHSLEGCVASEGDGKMDDRLLAVVGADNAEQKFW